MSERELNSQEIMKDQNHRKPPLKNLCCIFAIKQIFGINSSESWGKKPHLWFKYVSVYCSLGKIMTYPSLSHKSSQLKGRDYTRALISESSDHWNYFKRCLLQIFLRMALKWFHSLFTHWQLELCWQILR